MTELVATGAPSSGTHYLATLLGWEHEAHYRPDGPPGPAPRPEVSWLAAPYLDRRAFVIHLVRHPALCVATTFHRGWLSPLDPWGRVAYRHTGTWDPWEFWLRWTDIAAKKAHATIRLEDIAHLGPPVAPSHADPVEPPMALHGRFAAACDRYGYPWPLPDRAAASR